MNEIIFLVEKASEGGFTARALSESIFTEAESLDELRQQVRDAVRCHFDEGKAPKLHLPADVQIARDTSKPETRKTRKDSLRSTTGKAPSRLEWRQAPGHRNGSTTRPSHLLRDNLAKFLAIDMNGVEQIGGLSPISAGQV